MEVGNGLYVNEVDKVVKLIVDKGNTLSSITIS